jgi:FMN phosphatase YigB (HAD superfamily)
MVKLVLFDVGGVLIDLRSEQARRSLESEYGMARTDYEALARCTYVDDSKINVLAAIKCGMRGIIFNNYADLVESLRREKLLH